MADSKNPKRWIEYAENDFQAAMKVKEAIASSAAFLFHASAEKYLKAVLLAQGVIPPKVHDIDVLLNLISPKVTADSREQQAARLFDIVFNFSRYSDDLIEIGLEEARSVCEAAFVLRNFARGILKI